MGTPVFYRCDKPEEIKDRKVGEVISFNKDSREATIKIAEEYCDIIYGFIMNQCPISFSCRNEPAIPEKSDKVV